MALLQLTMPKWGLSMTEGTIVEWLLEEGEQIAAGDQVVEVSTEKIDGAVEAPDAGTLLRRVAAEGETLPVGALLAVVGDPATDVAEVDAFVAEAQASFVPADADEDAGPATEDVEVDGRRVRILATGPADDDGPPLVLIHGFGGDLDNWRFVIPEWAKERSLIAIDLPGHGGSSKDVGDGTLAVLTGAVLGVLDARGVERAHLVGHSLGGLVATAIAAEHPDRVLSLSLIAPAGIGPEISIEYIDGFVAATSRKQLKPVLAQLFAAEGTVTRELVDEVLRYKRLDGVDAALRAIAGHGFRDGRQADVDPGRLALDDVPALVIWGRQDRVIPAAHAELVPDGVRVELLDDTGHSPHVERAGDVHRLVAGHVLGAVPA